jgi:uncharacterized membrane protein
MSALSTVYAVIGLGTASALVVPAAHADNWSIGLSVGLPGVVVVAPAPVYVSPPPRYYVPPCPPRGYYSPGYYPPGSYRSPVIVEYGGDRDYERHRGRHHRHDDDDDD